MNFKLILLLCYLVTAKASGEMIGPVEYHLPTALTEDWDVGNKLEDKLSKTVVYIPREAEKCEEFFEVNINKIATDVENLAGIRASIAKQFSDMEVHLEVLDKSPENLLYEWKANDNGHERIHGWGRLFSTRDGTVLLSYQTDDVSKVEEARGQWLPALKEANIVQRGN